MPNAGFWLVESKKSGELTIVQVVDAMFGNSQHVLAIADYEMYDLPTTEFKFLKQLCLHELLKEAIPLEKPVDEKERTIKLELVGGVESDSVYLNDCRIAVPKPWGSGRIRKSWRTSLRDLKEALKDVEK